MSTHTEILADVKRLKGIQQGKGKTRVGKCTMFLVSKLIPVLTEKLVPGRRWKQLPLSAKPRDVPASEQ